MNRNLFVCVCLLGKWGFFLWNTLKTWDDKQKISVCCFFFMLLASCIYLMLRKWIRLFKKTKKKEKMSKLLNILTMNLLQKTFDSIVTQSSIGSITYLWCVAWSARESFLSHFYELFMVIPYYDESFSSFYDNFFFLYLFLLLLLFH